MRVRQVVQELQIGGTSARHGPRGASMRVLAGVVGVALFGTGVQANAESIKFAILRNGEQIGTHAIDINRAGSETSVRLVTDLTVKVMFVTAYRLEHTATEKWVDGRLVALNSNTNDNGTIHKVTLAATPAGVQIHADGKARSADRSIVTGSLWNQDVTRHSSVLDSQDGEIRPLSVVDHGLQPITIKSRVVKAHHYTLKSKYTQEVWYDEQSRFVKMSLIGRDGSEIVYQLL
jgi:Family of unknown function (DUF6134)